MVANADKKVSFGKEMFAYSSIRQCTGTGKQGQQGFYYALYNVASAHFTLPLCPVGRFRSAGLFYCRLKSCLLQKFLGNFQKSGQNRVFQVSY